MGAGSCHGTLLKAYLQDWERAPAAATGRKVEPKAERLAQPAATGRKVGPMAERLVPPAERLVPVAGRLQPGRQVSVDPPAEPRLQPSGFWVEFFELPATSTALFGL